MSEIAKLFTFVRLYGVGRTIAKVAGRIRPRFSLIRPFFGRRDIALIGCGQFGFATIGYFIGRSFGARFLWCYDPEESNRNSFARYYRVPHNSDVAEGWNDDPRVKFVYIASNHASHSSYAIKSLEAGKIVYIEKPVSVSFQQLRDLEFAREESQGTIFAGYNRPHSKAVRVIRAKVGTSTSAPMTLCCYVSGHQISKDHWYRDEVEGTRICGNAGHWIDLFVNMCHWRDTLPEKFFLRLTPAIPNEPDDNFSLTITTDLGDLFTLVLSSRSEPYGGINETINLQWGGIIAKIDDFCRMELWEPKSRRQFRFWHKDVGHKRAIMQPFSNNKQRLWGEVLRSTILTLSVMEMVKSGETERTVDLPIELASMKR
jgi:predicted dehydrogenase